MTNMKLIYETLRNAGIPIDTPDFESLPIIKGGYAGSENHQLFRLHILYDLPSLSKSDLIKIPYLKLDEFYDSDLNKSTGESVSDKITFARDNGKLPYYVQESMWSKNKPNGYLAIYTLNYIINFKPVSWRKLACIFIDYKARSCSKNLDYELTIGDDFVLSNMKETNPAYGEKSVHDSIGEAMSSLVRQHGLDMVMKIAIEEDNKLRHLLAEELTDRLFKAIVPQKNIELNFEMNKLPPESTIKHWALAVGDLYDDIK